MLVLSGTGVQLAGRYRLQERIAAGGVGEVWRAADTVLGRTVAVKLLRPEYADHAETLERFRAEARLAARLAHPGIVRVYDFGQDGAAGVPFLVMELVDGPSLAGVLAGGPLQPSWVLDMIGQVAAGLAAAHATGLVHRDIKPANLLLAPDGTVKITDFGIAHAAGSAPLTRTGTLPGTPGYLAPERAAGAAAAAASDLYSLGVVAWECLTGAPPFTGTPLEIALAHAQRDLPPLPAGIPAGIAGLVAELTGKDPSARPTGAAVAARASRLRASVAAGTAPPGMLSAGQRARPAATLTLAAVTAPDAPPLHQRLRRSRLRPGRAAVLAAAGIIAAAGLSAALVAGISGAAPRQHLAAGRPPASAPALPAARMVTVDRAALDGQPAAAVLGQLRRDGLQPRLVQQPNGRLEPGTVIAVQPAGQVPAGTTVTVTAAVPPPGRQHQRDNGQGADGGDGG